MYGTIRRTLKNIRRNKLNSYFVGGSKLLDTKMKRRHKTECDEEELNTKIEQYRNLWLQHVLMYYEWTR